MLYEDILKFLKTAERNYRYANEIKEFMNSLKTEVSITDLDKYEKDRAKYLLSLNNPFFFSFEILGESAYGKVVVLTYDTELETLNIVYSDVCDIRDNPEDVEVLCKELIEQGYQEICLNDYYEICKKISCKEIDGKVVFIKDSINDLLSVKNSFTEKWKNDTSVIKSFYHIHPYMFSKREFKQGKNTVIGWQCETVFFDRDTYVYLPPIPETLFDIPVMSVEGTFKNCYDLIAAPHIPDTVIDMSKAFMDCSKMRYAENLPSKVEKIDYAFAGCSSLCEIGWKEIPETVRTVRCAFACSAITNAPDFSKATKITSMQETFRDSAVFTITWAPNVKKAKRTYKNCNFLIGVNKFPEYIESLEETFAGCRELRSVAGINHSKSLKSMNGTFLDCFSLENISDLPDELEEMKETFSHCSSLSYCPVLPKTVRKVDGVFDSCKSFNHTNDIELDEENHTIKGIVYYGHYSCKFSFDYLKVKEEILQNAKANSKFYEYRAFCCNGIRKNAECEPIGSDTLPFVINENIGYVKYLISDGFRDDEIDDILKLLEIKKA